MIISHQYQYIFIEVPLTGSWAIRQELCKHYDGEPALHKHATYPEIHRALKADLSDYLVFGTVRHPLDKVVSRYFKLLTDHRGAFTDEQSADQLLTDYADYKKFTFIQKSASFSQYLHRYYRWPYGDIIDVASDRYNVVIRFEDLQAGFSEVLSKLGIDQVRPIPVTNRTQGRKADWYSYFTPEVIDHAKRVFGPYMQKWDYAFPESWGNETVSSFNKATYWLLCNLRQVYYTRFRYNQNGIARFVRHMRSHWQ
jgi:hypothetical protein